MTTELNRTHTEIPAASPDSNEVGSVPGEDHLRDERSFPQVAERDARAELVAQTNGVLDEVRHSINRAEQCLFTIWQQTLRVGDEHLATELTEASHLLRAAHRDLARRTSRVDRTGAVQESSGQPLIGTSELGASIESDDSATRPILGDVQLDREGNRIILWLWGEHDHSNLDRLNQRLVESADLSGNTVIADLRNATFIDGSTVGAFLRARALLDTHRKSLWLRWPSTHQRRMLYTAGLDDLITPETPSNPHRAATATDPIGS